MCDAPGHGFAACIPGSEKPHDSPGRLRRCTRTYPLQSGIIIGVATLTPSAIGVLEHAQPLRRLLHVGLVVPYSHGFQTTQNTRGAVDIVDAPAPEPGTIWLLLLQDKIDCPSHALVFASVDVHRQHL